MICCTSFAAGFLCCLSSPLQRSPSAPSGGRGIRSIPEKSTNVMRALLHPPQPNACVQQLSTPRLRLRSPPVYWTDSDAAISATARHACAVSRLTMEGAGLALRHGLGCGVASPSFSPSLRFRSCASSPQRVAAAHHSTRIRALPGMQLARSLKCGVPLFSQGRSHLCSTLFSKQCRSGAGRSPQHRSVAQAADQSSVATTAPAPVIERPAETSVGNEGTPGASSSKSGSYPFAEIEPKWQRCGAACRPCSPCSLPEPPLR